MSEQERLHDGTPTLYRVKAGKYRSCDATQHKDPYQPCMTNYVMLTTMAVCDGITANVWVGLCVPLMRKLFEEDAFEEADKHEHRRSLNRSAGHLKPVVIESQCEAYVTDQRFLRQQMFGAHPGL